MLLKWKHEHESKALAVQELKSLATHSASTVPDVLSTYVGRPELEADLLTATEGDRIALVGLSGTGKTQLAAFFFSMPGLSFSFRWWISGADRLTFISELAAIGRYVGVPVDVEDVEQAARQTASILAQRHGWLLVIDDVSQGDIFDFLPSATGTIIVTTQIAQISAPYNCIAVAELSPEQSCELLRKSPVLAPAGSDLLDEIAKLCTGLAMALSQVASYATFSGIGPAAIRGLLLEHRLAVLSRGYPGAPCHPYRISGAVN